MTFAPQFDHIVVNDNLDAAKAEMLALVGSFLEEDEANGASESTGPTASEESL